MTFEDVIIGYVGLTDREKSLMLDAWNMAIAYGPVESLCCDHNCEGRPYVFEPLVLKDLDE